MSVRGGPEPPEPPSSAAGTDGRCPRRVLLDLLRMNVAPLAVFQVLKSMCAGQRLPAGPEGGPPATPAPLPADARGRWRAGARAGAAAAGPNPRVSPRRAPRGRPDPRPTLPRLRPAAAAAGGPPTAGPGLPRLLPAAPRPPRASRRPHCSPRRGEGAAGWAAGPEGGLGRHPGGPLGLSRGAGPGGGFGRAPPGGGKPRAPEPPACCPPPFLLIFVLFSSVGGRVWRSCWRGGGAALACGGVIASWLCPPSQ